MNANESAVYRFGDVRVDRQRYRMERGGRAVSLEPRAFDLLVLLVESRGRVLTKKEILDRLWTDTAVTDNALTRIVAQLRKALGDDARESKYIETVPTRGYRWPADVRCDSEEEPATPAAPAATETKPRVRRTATMVALIAMAAVAVVLASMLGIARAPAREKALDSATVRPVQLTVSPGLDAYPSFSPDGTSITYATDRSGAFEIAVRSLAAGAGERPITSDGLQNVEPAWSPDGSLIAYHSRTRGGIWIVPALGGVPRQISQSGSWPAWSPDGQRLAFQSDPSIEVTPSGYGANIPSLIWIVDRDGGHAHPATRAASPIGAHASPSWSPSGRHLAFVNVAAGPMQVWTVAADGGEPVHLAGLDGAFDPVFAPDGQAVYAATGRPELRRVAVSADSARPTGSPQAIVIPGIASVRHVSMARDGNRVAFTGMDISSNLWTLPMSTDMAAGAPTPVTDDRGVRQTEPAFSPDGKALAFWSVRPGSGAEIWIVDAAGGRSSPVTVHELFNSSFYTRPAWTRAGDAITFLAHSQTAVRSVKVDLASRREATLLEVPAVRGANPNTPPYSARDLTLSPDGSMAAYSQIDPATGRSRLFVRAMASATPRPLTGGESSERYPVWSNDGRSLAFEIKNGDATHIAVVPAAGGTPRLVTSDRGESWPYSWSADNDKILFAGLRAGVWNVWWVSTSTAATRQLTQYTSPHTFARYPAWSPGGDRIAYELGTVTGNIWIGSLRDANLRRTEH